MTKNGLLQDVIIEDHGHTDPRTGMDIKDGFMVWTHKDAGEVIRAIPGVHRVNQYETLYFVDLDPRYDREFLRAEIEAQIKINFSEVTP